MISRKTALLMAGLALCMAATSGRAAIIISEVDPNGSAAGSTYGADWFELTNTGAVAVDITGWKMDDSSAAFATAVPITTVTVINPGQSVVFAEDSVSNVATPANDPTIMTNFINAWFGGTAPAGFTMGFYGGSGVGLSSSGDGVNIFDGGGTLVATASVSFGATTLAGGTLDNAGGATGSISTGSVAGVNGAFLAVGSSAETGSPGRIATPAPEPASLGVLGLAGVALLVRRRRS